MPAPAIRVDAVRRHYVLEDFTELVALHDVDLTVPAGRFVSVIGPSGCGKSTLLRIMAGLEEPDAGTVTLGGVSPTEAAADKRIGLVPQAPALLPWLSVLDNVRLPRRVNRGANKADLPDPVALLERAGLGDALHQLPHQLSGGMQQRAAIVRAFALHPEVLLMDEPFSALDELTRESLQEQLLDLWSQLTATVVFVTHSVSEAVRLSDQVVVMAPKPGRVVETVDIDLPRPRTADLIRSPEFHDHEIVLRELLRWSYEQGAAR